MLHSRVASWPYPQTLDYVGNTCQGQTLQLITKICKLWTKSSITLAPGVSVISIFSLSLTKRSNKLSHLSFTSFSSLVYYWQVRPVVILGLTLTGFITNIRLGCKSLQVTNGLAYLTSSSVTPKKVVNIDFRAQCYKKNFHP